VTTGITTHCLPRPTTSGHDAVHLATAVASAATVMASADDRLLEAAHAERIATSNPLDPI
jgi:predicted nucleic acid-binding protein